MGCSPHCANAGFFYRFRVMRAVGQHVRMQLTRHSPPASAGVRGPGEISPRGRENSAFQVIPVLNRVITFFHLRGWWRGRRESPFMEKNFGSRDETDFIFARGLRAECIHAKFFGANCNLIFPHPGVCCFICRIFLH